MFVFSPIIGLKGEGEDLIKVIGVMVWFPNDHTPAAVQYKVKSGNLLKLPVSASYHEHYYIGLARYDLPVPNKILFHFP